MGIVENRAKTLALLAQFGDTTPDRSEEFYILLAKLTVGAPERLARVHRSGLYDPPSMEQVTFHLLRRHYHETLQLTPRAQHQELINVMTWIMEASPWVFVSKRGVMLKSDLEKETDPNT